MFSPRFISIIQVFQGLKDRQTDKHEFWYHSSSSNNSSTGSSNTVIIIMHCNITISSKILILYKKLITKILHNKSRKKDLNINIEIHEINISTV